MNRLFIICTFFIIISCSKETSEEPIVTDPDVVEEPVLALDVINIESISESPEGTIVSKIIYDNKLYAVYFDKKTYAYDFLTGIWNLVSDTDNDIVPGYFLFGKHTSFIENEKWYLFSNNELMQYDFVINDWTSITRFIPGNGRFYSTGFFKDNNIYFIDLANGNTNIYKYSFESKEVSTIGTYENPGDKGVLSNSIFKIEGVYYYSQLLRTGIRISKFLSDYNELETLTETYDFSNEVLESGVSWLYEDKIIFGLGGYIFSEANGTVLESGFNKQLFVYDTKTNEFSTLETIPFEKSFISAQSFSYNNEHYLFGGNTINNDQVAERYTMNKLTFEVVEK